MRHDLWVYVALQSANLQIFNEYVKLLRHVVHKKMFSKK